MKLNRKWWLAAGIVGVLGAGVGSAPVFATPSTNSSTTLVQGVVQPTRILSHGRTTTGSAWGTLLKTWGMTDGYVVENDFDPGQTTGWHSHPGPSLVFVVSGTITDYDTSVAHCAPQRFTAGQVFTDAGGKDVHMLRNNTKEPAETIAVQFIPSGQERKIDQPKPAECR